MQDVSASGDSWDGETRPYRFMGTFAFSSSNQFKTRLMCVTGGEGGAGRARTT
jgi:hypothetical protein